jgi:hypothetical protein
MKEPAPCDDEHNTLLVWAWSYFEYHDFLPIGENWGWALQWIIFYGNFSPKYPKQGVFIETRSCG